jgi:hypothetical protein
MNFFRKFFHSDAEEEVKKQILKRQKSIANTIESFKEFKSCRKSILNAASTSQEGRDLAIKLLN